MSHSTAKYILKFLGFMFLFITVIIITVIILNYRTISSVQNAVPAFYAKEMCSCIFITGQSEEFCLNYARQPLDPYFVKTDYENKTVTVSAAGLTKKGRYISGRLGCVLE